LVQLLVQGGLDLTVQQFLVYLILFDQLLLELTERNSS